MVRVFQTATFISAVSPNSYLAILQRPLSCNSWPLEELGMVVKVKQTNFLYRVIYRVIIDKLTLNTLDAQVLHDQAWLDKQELLSICF